MKTRDLSIGNRLHGNVAAILAGCPALTIPKDSRMRELMDYHGLPNVPYFDIKATDRVEDLIAKVDMQSHIKKHAANFDRFLRFLDDNGLEHIYKEDVNRRTAPLDEKMAAIEYPDVKSVLDCTKTEIIHRMGQRADYIEENVNSLKKQNKKLSQQNKNLFATEKKLQASDKAKKELEKKLTQSGKKLQKAEDKAKITEKKLKEAEDKAAKAQKQLKQIQSGMSFRIGRIITWLPRKLAGKK